MCQTEPQDIILVWSLFTHYASAGDPTHATTIGSNKLRKFTREAGVTKVSGSYARTSSLHTILTTSCQAVAGPNGKPLRTLPMSTVDLEVRSCGRVLASL